MLGQTDGLLTQESINCTVPRLEQDSWDSGTVLLTYSYGLVNNIRARLNIPIPIMPPFTIQVDESGFPIIAPVSLVGANKY